MMLWLIFYLKKRQHEDLFFFVYNLGWMMISYSPLVLVNLLHISWVDSDCIFCVIASQGRCRALLMIC